MGDACKVIGTSPTQKEQDPIQKVTTAKKGWGHGLRCREPA
jgi:hypothetical protein